MQKVTGAIKNKSRSIIALGKEFYYKQLNLSIEEAYILGAEVVFLKLIISLIK